MALLALGIPNKTPNLKIPTAYPPGKATLLHVGLAAVNALLLVNIFYNLSGSEEFHNDFL